MSSLEDIQQRIVQFRDDRNWKQFHNPKDVAISLILEASELLEHFQWKTLDEFKEHMLKSSEEVSDELVDILYWVLLLAHDLNVDLDKSFARKMTKNERKYPISKAKGNHKKYTEL